MTDIYKAVENLRSSASAHENERRRTNADERVGARLAEVKLEGEDDG
jgi:hypothetical protein